MVEINHDFCVKNTYEQRMSSSSGKQVEKMPKNQSSIGPNKDANKKSVLIVMATNTAAQFFRWLFLIPLRSTSTFFSLRFSISASHQSVLVSSFWSLRHSVPITLLPALCSVLSYFPDLSQSIFLFVLSAFSSHSMNYRCQGTACARVPLQMMNSCKSFHQWKTQINGDI